MTTFFFKWIDHLRTSFWCIPAMMATGAVLFAYLMLYIDANMAVDLPGPLAWLEARDAESVRTLLATTASSVVTIVSVVFSITIVVLTLAASQLGPRLLRSFMRDRGTQFTLGTFVSTFVYCIIVLHTAGLFSNEEKLPNLAAFVALLLTVFSLAVLIYFIHHIATMIQSPSIIARVSSELHNGIARAFPKTPATNDDEALGYSDKPARPLTSEVEGYLQAIDYEGMLAMAVKNDVTIDLLCRPGTYVITDAPLATTFGYDLSSEAKQSLRGCFVMGPRRTDTQDVRYGVSELVEVAMRALSPGINDPITALNCIDHIGGSLAHVGSLAEPAQLRRDAEGIVRMRLKVTTFADFADSALNQIRQHARNNVAVTIRILEMISQVAPHVPMAHRRDALRRHVEIIHTASADLPDEADRADVTRAYDAAIAALA